MGNQKKNNYIVYNTIKYIMFSPYISKLVIVMCIYIGKYFWMFTRFINGYKILFNKKLIFCPYYCNYWNNRNTPMNYIIEQFIDRSAGVLIQLYRTLATRIGAVPRTF